MVSRLVLTALATCAFAGVALAEDTKQPLSTDISARSGGGFSGGGGRGFSGGGFSGGGRGFSGGGFSGSGMRGVSGAGFSGGGMRAFAPGGGMRTFSGGGARFAGAPLRAAGPVNPRFGAATFAGPGVGRAFTGRGFHHNRHFRRVAVIAGVGGFWWGSDYWYPYSYADGPYCSGYDGNGCVLRWANVPVGGGYAEPRCVSYCPY